MSLSTVNPKGQGVVHNNPMIWYVITALIGNALKRETTFLVELGGGGRRRAMSTDPQHVPCRPAFFGVTPVPDF